MFFENSNKPHQFGIISITDFTPFPKNPVISSFFRQIHYAEELGSGFKKIAKYANAYFGTEPLIQEKDIFRFEAYFGTEMLKILDGSSSTSINKELGEKLGDRLGEKLGENRKKILVLMKENRYITIPELSGKLGISTTAIEKNIKHLKGIGLIERIGPDKGGTWRVL